MRTQRFMLVFFAVVLSLSASIASQQPTPAQPDAIPRLKLEDFRSQLASGTLLVVDVRDGLVYRAGHIPGAISVPLGDLEKHAPELRGRAQQRLVVTYCSCPSEQTALTAAVALWKSGLTNVSVLIGGYPEWVATGGAIEKGGGG